MSQVEPARDELIMQGGFAGTRIQSKLLLQGLADEIDEPKALAL
jgi:hypothetical protein